MANLHCECQELKPKVETNSSFLVLHPPLGVDIVNTVESHLNWTVAHVMLVIGQYASFCARCCGALCFKSIRTTGVFSIHNDVLRS